MFKLSKFCDESLVRFDLKGKTKHKVIEELVEVAAASKSVNKPLNNLKLWIRFLVSDCNPA